MTLATPLPITAHVLVTSEPDMYRAVGRIRVLVAGLALVILPSASWGATDALSPATRELLREHKLRKLARSDAAAAIRELDRLRSGAMADTLDSAIGEVALEAAHKADPLEARGLYLSAAAAAWPAALAQAAEDGGQALDLYGAAVAGLIGSLQRGSSAALRGGTEVIDGPLARYELSWVDAGPEWTPATHDFRPASDIRRKKKSLESREGLGAPVVAAARYEGDGSPPCSSSVRRPETTTANRRARR
jgi:hypothetical protein